MTNEQKEQTRKQLHRLLDIVLDTNGLEARSKEETGTLPTMFFRYSGHVNKIEIDLHPDGWERGADCIELIDRYMDGTNTITDEEIESIERRCQEVSSVNVKALKADIEAQTAHLNDLKEQLQKLEKEGA